MRYHQLSINSYLVSFSGDQCRGIFLKEQHGRRDTLQKMTEKQERYWDPCLEIIIGYLLDINETFLHIWNQVISNSQLIVKSQDHLDIIPYNEVVTFSKQSTSLENQKNYYKYPIIIMQSLRHIGDSKKHCSLPRISSRCNILQQHNEKTGIFHKESSFIKKIKGSKSIMMANENRKQKIVLNSLIIDSSSKKKNRQKKALSSSPNHKSFDKINGVGRKAQFLFPSPYNSLQIYINMVHKNNKFQPLHFAPVMDVGAYLIEQTKKKKMRKMKFPFKSEQQQGTYLKQCLKWNEFDRYKQCQTEIKGNKSQIKNHEIQKNKYKKFTKPINFGSGNNKKCDEQFRSAIHQPKDQQQITYKQLEMFSRWEFSNMSSENNTIQVQKIQKI